MQKLITLIVGALIIYVLMNTRMSDLQKIYPKHPESSEAVQVVEKEKTEPVPEGSFLERSLSKVLINILKTDEGRMFFEHLIQPVNKPIGKDGVGFKLDNSQLVHAMFKINTLGGTKGEGPVSCGHVVTARYQISTLNNELVEEDTKTFNVGGNGVMRGMSDIVVGMYVGETREGIVMPPYTIGAKDTNKAYRVKISVQNIVPKVFVDNNVKIFDDEISYKKPYLCGERAIFDVKVSKCSGEVVYDSVELGSKVNMVLGDLGSPMIFSHALFGKIPSGTRTVIAQGKYLGALASTKVNKIFKSPLPVSEFYVIEFKNFEEDGRSATTPIMAPSEVSKGDEEAVQDKGSEVLKKIMEKLPPPAQKRHKPDANSLMKEGAETSLKNQ